jgi:hypothetical protein
MGDMEPVAAFPSQRRHDADPDWLWRSFPQPLVRQSWTIGPARKPTDLMVGVHARRHSGASGAITPLVSRMLP